MNPTEITVLLELLRKFNTTEQQELRSLIEGTAITEDENKINSR